MLKVEGPSECWPRFSGHKKLALCQIAECPPQGSGELNGPHPRTGGGGDVAGWHAGWTAAPVSRTLLLTDQGAEREDFAQALPSHRACSVGKQGGQVIQSSLELAFPCEYWSLKRT